MDENSFKFPLRLALFLLAVSWTINLCGAQSTKPAPQPANTPAAQSAASKAKNLTPPPGKMRGLTNEMRKAAAVRNADRKARARVNGNSTSGQTGGQQ